MADYRIEPITGDNYEGRQIGYMIFRGDEPFLRCFTGGTGDCWNVDFADEAANLEADPFHICQDNLDGLIQALTVLRDSAANAEHIERWA